MAKKHKQTQDEELPVEEAVEAKEQAEAGEVSEAAENPEPQQAEAEEAQPSEAEVLHKKLDEEHDQFLRLAAEYDNFRKRSRKEREALYTDVRAETVKKFLPVFDNLERALAHETADEQYKKGVELTMTELRKIMTGLGVEEFGAAGEPFDPNAHNAVMHTEDESLGENVVAEVFQRGFKIGEKVIRFAVVKVAN